jgi:hypothetical protein
MANENQELQDETIYSPTYKTVSEYPAGKTAATIYFHGLLGVCFDGSDKCIVGANNKASPHQVKIQIKEVGSCTSPSKSLPASFDKIEIRVTKPSQEGVWVYAPTPEPDPVDGRYSYVYYGIDLESPAMHNRKLRKVPGALSPGFHITNGLFYTCKISQSKFAMKKGASEGPVKKVGLVLAADIYLEADGKIEFFCDDDSTACLSLPEEKGKRYEIAITNSCESGSTAKPDFSLMSPTDFQQNYLVIDGTDVTSTDQFDLTIKENSGIKGAIKFGSCNFGDIVFSDPAPCLPVTFGRSRDLD